MINVYLDSPCRVLLHNCLRNRAHHDPQVPRLEVRPGFKGVLSGPICVLKMKKMSCSLTIIVQFIIGASGWFILQMNSVFVCIFVMFF